MASGHTTRTYHGIQPTSMPTRNTGMRGNAKTFWSTDPSGTLELKDFNRTLAEIEWLLLALILVYLALPDEDLESRFLILIACSLFALFTIGFRYLNLFTLPARWKFTIETWAMMALTAVAVWFTGKVDSPLLSLFLLVIIFSALTLGKLITLLEVLLIASFYLLAAYHSDGTDIYRYASFSQIMLRFAPFVLVAYVTSLLAADFGFARAVSEQLAGTDELTGLPNMRGFRLALGHRLHAARHGNATFAVMMIDVDNLKTINDRHGHETGNRVIRAVAEAIRRSLRTSDIAARYGGDEFVALLLQGTEQSTREAGQRILRQVSSGLIETGNGSVDVSVSIGFALFSDRATDAEGLIEQADQALYASKQNGRNQVTSFADLQAPTGADPARAPADRAAATATRIRPRPGQSAQIKSIGSDR